MTDLSLNLLSGTIALTALTIVSLITLRGWRLWVELRRHEIDVRPAMAAMHDDMPPANTGSRIELADLRERVRKLEAIAAGVDL